MLASSVSTNCEGRGEAMWFAPGAGMVDGQLKVAGSPIKSISLWPIAASAKPFKLRQALTGGNASSGCADF
jgi:hypothetical protein